MRLADYPVFSQGRRWACTLNSASATIFLADLTDRLTPNDLASNGFGMDDVATHFASSYLQVTLLLLPDKPVDRVGGLLVATTDVDPLADDWTALPNWDGEPKRFCLDSGVAVLGAAEAFDDVFRIRSTEGAFDLARTIAITADPVNEHDRVYFNAETSCYDCWALGEPGHYEAMYIDLLA